MVEVLSTYIVEIGERWVDRARAAGVVLERVAEHDASAGFCSRVATLYRYISPDRGVERWALDVEGYDPPDSQWFATTVLDGRPSAAAIDAIARGAALAIGDRVAGA